MNVCLEEQLEDIMQTRNHVERILLITSDVSESKSLKNSLLPLDYSIGIIEDDQDPVPMLDAFASRAINVLICTFQSWRGLSQGNAQVCTALYNHNVLWLSPELDNQAHRIFIEWLADGWRQGHKPCGVHDLLAA